MFKRATDLCGAVILVVFSSPFIAVVLVLVYLLTGKAPLILQTRKISLDKKGFKIIKIRTIKCSEESLVLEKNSDKIFFKNEYEKYVPLFCRWLRKTGFDEILQVINVLKGDMSFVGPRPLLEEDLIIMRTNNPSEYFQRTKINSKPGITGYWQTYGNRTKGASNLLEFDETYEDQKSFLLDLKIVAKTIYIFMTATHSDSIVTNKFDKNKQLTPDCVYDFID